MTYCKLGKLDPAVKEELKRIKDEIVRLLLEQPPDWNELLKQYALYDAVLKINS